MNRYWQVLQLCWGAAISTEMEYRLNFFLASLSSLGSLVGSVFGLFLFYRTGYTFQGWTWQEALVILGIFTLLQGFAGTFLSPNLGKLVQYVQQGTLDFVLLKPISSQFWLSTHTFSLWGVPDIPFGIGIILYAGSQLKISFTSYIIALIPLSFGLISLYSLWFMLGATSIWFVKIYNLTEVLRGLVEAGRYPMVAYPAIYRWFFTFIVPVAFLTSVPGEALLGRTQWTWIASSGGLAMVLLLCSNLVWRFALRFYTSASS
jgi:ABC-2 type transport system permease protein